MFEQFLIKIQPLLTDFNCDFGYQQKNCKKHGHFKKKVNRTTQLVTYEIKIEKFDNDAAKIYTLIHEITHMYNHHLDQKLLTYAQKEYVADFVAKTIILEMGLQKELEKSKLSQKWNVDSYGLDWLKQRPITLAKRKIIREQCIKTVEIVKFLAL